MKIGFKPQRLIHNIALEQVLENGNAIRRVIEVPGNKAKTIDITYKKSEFMPTQWYVANYTVSKRNTDGKIIKSFNNNVKSQNESLITIQNIYRKALKETKINIKDKNISKKSEFRKI